MKRIFLTIALATTLVACNKEKPTPSKSTDNGVTGTTGSPGSTGTTGSTGSTGNTGSTGSTGNTYTLVEDFENATKTAYADANVMLTSGNWDFNNSLLTNRALSGLTGNYVELGGNNVVGATSNGGAITMLFDVSNVSTISFSYESRINVYSSTDGGKTFNLIASNTSLGEVKAATLVITTSGKIRFKFDTGYGGAYIDNIIITGVQ